MGSLALEDKKSVGMMTTEIKNVFQEKLASKEEEIIASMSVLDEPIDLTVPGKKLMLEHYIQLHKCVMI